jgi:hypothetical protein
MCSSAAPNTFLANAEGSQLANDDSFAPLAPTKLAASLAVALEPTAALVEAPLGDAFALAFKPFGEKLRHDHELIHRSCV